MKIHQICYFLALCEERSFTRAAKRCGVAQPSLTRAIQQLEHEFDGQLFERSKSAVRLTNLEILVRPDFVRIKQAVAEVTQKIAAFNAARAVEAHTNTGDALCERQR